ncbi:hypothetical protein [Pedosphaera parvula]|uniref:Uncharacterized protein n=1 Tax=Pedosphaera parvula (strain Ellin514) TaxID=320771 RepID=B9XPJ3_PEDPL|nr:hypothetical protein [Pedosphaera parvula]EEF58221.1 hypothetical protein Cflav_PD1421 [Pedosphaera parvula Ellin514]
MAKKFRLASSREAEQRKITQAIKMMLRGESSAHGRRTNPKAVRHNELETDFIPVVESIKQPHKFRRGRHHPPPSFKKA